MRQITIDEWNKYKWIEAGSFGSNFIRGIERTIPPPMPDDGFVYELIETTTFSDAKQTWKWMPKWTYED